jgi:hypothetical protein
MTCQYCQASMLKAYSTCEEDVFIIQFRTHQLHLTQTAKKINLTPKANFHTLAANLQNSIFILKIHL